MFASPIEPGMSFLKLDKHNSSESVKMQKKAKSQVVKHLRSTFFKRQDTDIRLKEHFAIEAI